MAGRQQLSFLRPLVISALLCLSACNLKPIAEDLDQIEANKIVALLSSQGISSSAERASSGKESYRVRVRHGNYHEAVQILDRNGIPARDIETFSDIVQRNRLFPGSSKMEALRIDHALGLELKQLLENIDSVSSAEVVVRSNFIPEGAHPGVAVTVREVGGRITGGEVASIVRRTIPGVLDQDITVVIRAASDLSGGLHREGVYKGDAEIVSVPLEEFLLWRVPKGDLLEVVAALSICIVVMGFACGVIGYTYGMYRSSLGSRGGRRGSRGDDKKMVSWNRPEFPEV